MSSAEYRAKVLIVVKAFFPHLDAEAQAALAWLIADFLLSLDTISQNMPE
jgi:hypothetical protein